MLLRAARLGDRRAPTRRRERGRSTAHIRLRRETTKGKKARCEPLWWDAGTLTDLAEWQAERMRHGARGGDPFVCSVLSHRRGQSIQRAGIRRRFISACKVLRLARLARLRTLTIHHGRHTFISHALAGGRTLAEVRAAAGHSNVAITSGYALFGMNHSTPTA